MSKKSLDQIVREIQKIQEQKRSQALREESMKIEEARKRNEWIRERMRMFENNVLTTSSSSSAGAGGGRRPSREDVFQFKNAENVLFIYEDGSSMFFVLYDFTNDSLVGPTKLSDNLSFSDIYSLQEKCFLIIGNTPNNTSECFIVNSSGEIVDRISGYDETYLLDDKYMIIKYSVDGVYDYKIYGDDSGKSTRLNVNLDMDFDNPYHEYSKNGFYFIKINLDGSKTASYRPDNGVVVDIMQTSSDTYMTMFQHRFCDISYILTVNENINESILKVLRDGVVIDQFILSNENFYNYSYSIFTNELGHFILQGYDNFNNSYILTYDGQFDFVSYPSSTTWVINNNYSYFVDISGFYRYNSFSIINLQSASYDGSFINGTDTLIYNFFREGIYVSEYMLDSISYKFINNDDVISYIGYDVSESKYLRINYDSSGSQSVSDIGTSSVPPGQLVIIHLVDTFIMLDEVESGIYSPILITPTSITEIGITFSTGISYSEYGKKFIIRDNVNGTAYYFDGQNFEQANTIKNDYEYRDNYLSNDYIEDVFVVIHEPSEYSILSSSGLSDEFYPYDMDFPNGGFYQSFDKFITVQNTSNLGAFYFTDRGNNDIGDGGGDMYDDGNMIYTNLSGGNIPYTHTQLNISISNDSIGIGNDPSDYPMDGQISDGSLYFGASGSYFTNLYPGLFILHVENVSDINSFYLDGNLGADGEGLTQSYKFYVDSNGDEYIWGSSPSIAEYIIFVRQVYDAGDPSINQIFIFNNVSDPESYVHEFDTTNSEDSNSVTFNGNIPNKISYLLLSKPFGSAIDELDIKGIVKKYIQLTDGKNINQVLSTMNSEYNQIVDILNVDVNYGTSVKIYSLAGDLLDSVDIGGVSDLVYVCKNRILFKIDKVNGDNEIWVYKDGFKKILENITPVEGDRLVYINDLIYND